MFFRCKSITKFARKSQIGGHYKLFQNQLSVNQWIGVFYYKLFWVEWLRHINKYVYFCRHKLMQRQMNNKKLYRSNTDKKLCGVCGGLAEYFEIDSTIIRLLWVVMTFFSAAFPGVLAYIVCALIVPKQS